MSVCVDLTCVDNWQFSDNLVGRSICSYCKSQQDRIAIFIKNWCVHDKSGRSQDHWPGYQWLLFNWDHALEVQRWKKVKILTYWPGSVHGYGVREKEPDEKMWAVNWWSGPTFPLQAREEGDDWGPVSCQEMGWVTRVSSRTRVLQVDRGLGEFPFSPRNQGGRVMGHNLNKNQVVQCQMSDIFLISFCSGQICRGPTWGGGGDGGGLPQSENIFSFSFSFYLCSL